MMWWAWLLLGIVIGIAAVGLVGTLAAWAVTATANDDLGEYHG